MPKARIAGLDLLRGFAILLVILRHSWPEAFGGGGIVGVVVFFTLSGYLITGLLVDDLRAHGRVRYGRFYRNRAIRLLPALGFLLAGFVVVEGIVRLVGDPGDVPRSVLVSLTYVMNIPGFDHGSPSLSHLWTLANEEQFYLLWPLILAVGFRIRGLRPVVLASGVVLVVALVASLALVGPDVQDLYKLPTTWTISMVIGAAAQLGRAPLDRVLRGRRATVGMALGLAGLVALAFVPNAKERPIVYLCGGAVIGLLTVLAIWGLRRIAACPWWALPLLGLGTVSYAAYLWNYPLTWWLRGAQVEAWAPLAAVLTILMAVLSWFAVERPFNRLRRRIELRERERAAASRGDEDRRMIHA